MRPEHSPGTRPMVAIWGAVAIVLLGACGGSDNGTPQGVATTPSTSPPAASSLSRTTFTPRTYTFKAEHVGSIRHSLEVDRPGLEDETQLLGPGAQGEVTVTLMKGRYEVYCPVGNRRERGMEVDVTVQ